MIDNNTGKLLRDLKECFAHHKAEVRIEYNGEAKEFTLEDFLERLGFRS